MTVTTQSWPPGTVLANRYQILRPLGHGGMGTLYLARDLRFTRRYIALKENGDRSPAAQVQFRLEAEVLATLHHPYLPAVTDHFTTADGRQFLVIDYVEGENLEERVTREGPLPEAQALAWADQVLDALAYLHAQSPPVIHRDVKPANIRITPEGTAVLVDFGVAKYMVSGQPTATVARAGSPGYAPIEQYAGGTDQRSDLYSLGATLYLALTGQVPPEAPLLAAGQALPCPRQLSPAISRRTEATILRAMQSDAGRRFQSATEMQAALRGEVARPPAGGGLLDGIRRMTQQQRAILLVGAVLVAAAMCAIMALGWWMGDRQRTTPTPTLAPTATVTVEVMPTATSVPVVAPTMVQPTDTVPPGAATSTLVPTSTPMPTTVQPADTVPPGAATSTLVPTSTPTPTATQRRPPPTHTPLPPTPTPESTQVEPGPDPTQPPQSTAPPPTQKPEG